MKKQQLMSKEMRASPFHERKILVARSKEVVMPEGERQMVYRIKCPNCHGEGGREGPVGHFSCQVCKGGGVVWATQDRTRIIPLYRDFSLEKNWLQIL